MDKKRIAVALSGGVDSSVAAHLLKAEYTPVGVTFVMHGYTNGGAAIAETAAAVSAAMGIEHHTVSAIERFERCVIGDFLGEYGRGATPNPCVVCNRTVKFPMLFEFADSHGCEYAATGHYARVERCGDRFILKKAADATKDQTYMLWGLTQDQLSRLVLPLGGFTKDEIREIAAEAALPSAKSKDSQDICFIPNGDYVRFLADAGADIRPGKYTDAAGNVLGDHAGHQCYTVGQRKGLGIAMGKHMYVIGKDAAANSVILGDDGDLYKTVVKATDINLIAGHIDGPVRLEAKVRYGKNATPATVYMSGEGELTAEFDTPVRAPAKGQSLVLYDGDTLVGGGVIR